MIKAIIFDFDGVIADDDSEQYYQSHKNMDEYMSHEQALASSPLGKGPTAKLLQKISFFQKMEIRKQENEPSYSPMLHTAIITARNAPAHERVVTTLKSLDVSVDEVFFLGGIEKKRVLEIMRPHIFFDDQMVHLAHLTDIPAVHIPFGIGNNN